MTVISRDVFFSCAAEQIAAGKRPSGLFSTIIGWVCNNPLINTTNKLYTKIISDEAAEKVADSLRFATKNTLYAVAEKLRNDPEQYSIKKNRVLDIFARSCVTAYSDTTRENLASAACQLENKGAAEEQDQMINKINCVFEFAALAKKTSPKDMKQATLSFAQGLLPQHISSNPSVDRIKRAASQITNRINIVKKFGPEASEKMIQFATRITALDSPNHLLSSLGIDCSEKICTADQAFDFLNKLRYRLKTINGLLPEEMRCNIVSVLQDSDKLTKFLQKAYDWNLYYLLSQIPEVPPELIAQKETKPILEWLEKNANLITKLDLSNTGVFCLPTEICQTLTSLKELRLQECWVSLLPKEIENLTNLEILDVSHHFTVRRLSLEDIPDKNPDSFVIEYPISKNYASFHGSTAKLLKLPVEINKLTNLHTLNLEFNGLTDLPPLDKLTKLTTLNLSYNDIEHPIVACNRYESGAENRAREYHEHLLAHESEITLAELGIE